ncbi:hypothetical protein BDN70DRAFT_693622 [Pholiota conissans]|uniref:F-box domain-containing protein n=1 Tax=Pholiota conissans TaxID=109636 RepID=A0A9P5Z240_9AGAR|nr:hypothetical protein BDN70DRAFT_693622 [Pholiota conissans]
MSADFAYCRYCNYLRDGEYLCDPTDPSICTPCKQLSELEDRVKTIRLMLVGLENQRQKLKTLANQHHDRFIHRLPPEITTQIFELCISKNIMDLNTEVIPTRHTIYAPLVISAVCTEWRNMAHTMPSLWNTLHLCPRRRDSNSFPKPSYVKKWIERAGGLPLSILLSVPSIPEEIATAVKVLKLINKYSTRWIDFRCESPPSLFSHLPSNTDAFPALRTLHLVNPSSSANTPLKIFPQRLETLAISGIELMTIDPRFDWSNLASLTMDYVTSAEAFEVLRRATNLTTCIFRSDAISAHDDVAYPLPQNILVHPRLQKLHIRSSLYEDVFRQLSCPSLEILALDVDDIPCVTLTVDFLRRSQCSLKTLHIKDGFGLHAPDIPLFLQNIPTLQHLSFNLQNNSLMVASVLFETLAEFSVVDGREVPKYLPLLCSLSYKGDVPYDEEGIWKSIPAIFGYRQGSELSDDLFVRRALQSLTVFAYPDIHTDCEGYVSDFDKKTLERILNLKKAGVKFKLQFGRFREDIIETLSNRCRFELS